MPSPSGIPVEADPPGRSVEGMTPNSCTQFQPGTSTDVGPDAEFEMTDEEVHLASAADTIGYVAAVRLADRFRALYDDLEEAREMIAQVVIEQAFVPYLEPDGDCITVTLPLQDTFSRHDGLDRRAALEVRGGEEEDRTA